MYCMNPSVDSYGFGDFELHRLEFDSASFSWVQDAKRLPEDGNTQTP